MNLEISPTYFLDVSKNDSLVSKNRRGNLSFRFPAELALSSPYDLQDEGAQVRTAPQTAAVSEAEHVWLTESKVADV